MFRRPQWLRRGPKPLFYGVRTARPHPWRDVFAALLALAAIDLLVVRDLPWLLEQGLGKRFAVNYALSAVVLGVTLRGLWGLWIRRPAWATACVAVLGVMFYAQAAYFAVYRKFIGVFDLRFFGSDPAMSMALYAENAAVAAPLLAGLGAVGVLGWLTARQGEVRRGLMARVVPGILALSLFALLCVNWYSAPSLQNTPVSLAGSLVRVLDIRQGRNTVSMDQRPVLSPQATPAGAPDIVIVVGESLNRFHMGLHGYARDTTPVLAAMKAAGEVLAFEDVLAIGPRTLVSVPYLLTGLQGIDPHGVIYRTPTVFQYAKSLGYTTALVTAQDFQWRNIDRLFVDRHLDHFRQGSDFASNVSVSLGADDHLVLERGVLPFLDKAPRDKPLLLVTQMSGSHPPYASQVPQALKQFLPEEHPNSINAYDNTVWYTDRYLGRLVRAIRAQRPGAWVFFSSDHGQHVTGQGSLFHGDLRDEVVRVPLLVFPPAGQGDRVRAARQAPVSQADIVATALELMGREPVAPIDGLSLLQPVPADRLRVTTPYVKTLHNDPVAALVFPDGRRWELQFDRNSVTLEDGVTVRPLSTLAPEHRAIFERRLQAP